MHTKLSTSTVGIVSTLVVLGAIGQCAAGFAPDILGWSDTISSRSAKTNTLLIPGGGAFLIWLPLFLGAIAFAVYGSFPAQRRDPQFQSIAAAAGVAYWANTIRSLYEPLYGPNWVSFLLLVVILLGLLVASKRAVDSGRQTFRRRLLLAPVLGQAGWISVATAAGLTQTAKFENFNPAGLDPLATALTVLTVFSPALLFLAWRFHSRAYAFAAAWGLAWIAIVNDARDLTGLSAFALLAATGVMLSGFGSRAIIEYRRSRSPSP